MPTSSADTEPLKQRNNPDWASNSVLWRPLFQEEWRNVVADFDIGTPTHTYYNIADRRTWWHGCSVVAVLRDFGYLPEYVRFAPPRAATWYTPTSARSFS
jgi:hypothetical protein